MHTGFTTILVSSAVAVLCVSPCRAGDWQTLSEHTRASVYHMENSINLVPNDPAGRQRAYEAYMATFSPQAVIHGLVASGDVDYPTLRRFYAALFGTMHGSVLVSDEMIVAGNMAAQRYHSLGRMTGEFDGAKLDNRLVGLRGQTFFRLGEDGHIVERWSNHDHAYRMALTRGPEGAAVGQRLASYLNGPGLTESEVYGKLTAYADAFNLIAAPEQREPQFLALFAPGVIVHGVGDKTAGFSELKAYFESRWSAFPDLVMRHEAMLSTWSMGASRWRATGSRRAAYGGQPEDWVPIQMRGEMIMRFSGAGQIEEIWINDRAAEPLDPAPQH